MTFAFVDLFAGVGGFHAVMSAFGGELKMAVEIDSSARETYKRNWGMYPERDVVEMANSRLGEIGKHTVLAGGFPCQPFSKSGRQRGMNEERGQMFDEIIKILDRYTPPVIVLENVRNITGPRQKETWTHIVSGLRDAGYRVPSAPCIVSPHRLPGNLGGAPQSRERVYILGTFVGRERALDEVDLPPVVPRIPDDNWSTSNWDLSALIESRSEVGTDKYRFTVQEQEWIDVWNDFLARLMSVPLPSHPLWSSYWHDRATVDDSAPSWKQTFERKNIEFYLSNRPAIQAWLHANPRLRAFPKSRQKLEWQAQDSPRDLRECLLHLRPSGIRAKKMTYTPALVAMAQTPLLGPYGRRMTPRETLQLQGFPDWFELDHQSDGKSYKQLGNAINVGVAYYVFRKHVLRDALEIVPQFGGAELVEAVQRAPVLPLVPDPTGRFADVAV